jgi:hypothetical protein
VVLEAWRQLSKIRRDQAAMLELPQAQFQALFANANRDPKKSKPFTAEDFCIFRTKPATSGVISAEAASVIMALRHENRCPSFLLSCWPQVLEAAPTEPLVPTTRVLKSDDDRVWLVAPTWEGQNLRAFVAVNGVVRGPTLVRDLDRPLLTYTVVIPGRKAAGWLESGLLLLVSN